MNHAVVIKGTTYGFSVYIDEQADFATIYDDVRNKFRESAKFFGNAKMAISFEGKGLVTNFTAVAATINNIGPGLEAVGPTCNFGGFSVFSKCILMFDMLAGRLELFPLLLLFHPVIWKDLFTKRVGTRKRDKAE